MIYPSFSCLYGSRRLSRDVRGQMPMGLIKVRVTVLYSITVQLYSAIYLGSMTNHETKRGTIVTMSNVNDTSRLCMLQRWHHNHHGQDD